MGRRRLRLHHHAIGQLQGQIAHRRNGRHSRQRHGALGPRLRENRPQARPSRRRGARFGPRWLHLHIVKRNEAHRWHAVPYLSRAVAPHRAVSAAGIRFLAFSLPRCPCHSHARAFPGVLRRVLCLAPASQRYGMEQKRRPSCRRAFAHGRQPPGRELVFVQLPKPRNRRDRAGRRR